MHLIPLMGLVSFFPSKRCNKWDPAYPLYFQYKALLLPQHVDYYYKILSNSVWILTNLFFQTGTRHLDNVFPLHSIVVCIGVLQLIYLGVLKLWKTGIENCKHGLWHTTKGVQTYLTLKIRTFSCEPFFALSVQLQGMVSLFLLLTQLEAPSARLRLVWCSPVAHLTREGSRG